MKNERAGPRIKIHFGKWTAKQMAQEVGETPDCIHEVEDARLLLSPQGRKHLCGYRIAIIGPEVLTVPEGLWVLPTDATDEQVAQWKADKRRLEAAQRAQVAPERFNGDA